jgi:hypothetical protein
MEGATKPYHNTKKLNKLYVLFLFSSRSKHSATRSAQKALTYETFMLLRSIVLKKYEKHKQIA